MVNRKVCLIILSLVIIILFVVSVFLMTMVDPIVLSTTTAPDSPTTTAPDQPDTYRRRHQGKKVKSAYDVILTESEGKLSYGLPKVSETEKSKGGVDDQIVSLYRNLAANGLLVNSSEVQDVVPPIKIPSSENQYKTISKTIEFSPVQITTPSVKGFRRSINDIHQGSRITEPSSGVILKIIDDLGHPRIEIKLEPKKAFEEKWRYYRRSANNTSDIHPESENIEEFDSEKETFIKILNNNTLIINELEEFQNSNESDVINQKNSLFGKNRTKANNYKEITLMISNAEHKHDLTGGASGSIGNNTELLNFDTLLDNTTKSNDSSVNFIGIISNINVTSNRSNEINPSLIVMNENDNVFKHDVNNVEDELMIINSSSIKNETESKLSAT